ncbi:MAG: acyltransferase [Deltaproteobacteria bacterium]|nr:acyltransferase [Deltaproteobacteria bacterium]
MKRLVKNALALLLSPLPMPGHPQMSGPGLHLRWRIGWLRGWLARARWRLQGQRFEIGKNFSLQGSMLLRGDGLLILGDDVIVGRGTLCTPFLHRPEAVIKIGSRTFINGTRFGCEKSIEIGADCILADVRIMDTDFHAVHKRRNERGMVGDVRPVRVGNNVWIAAGSAILKGTDIGDDCVIAFGSVVRGSVPAGRIFGGNPAKDIAAVPEGPSA